MTTMNQPEIVLCELADAASFGVESLSPFCLKVHRALRAAGLAYERRHGSRPDAFADHNPAGQVPVLLVDGKPTPDSTRILAAVEEIAGPVGGGGRDTRTSAEAWLWEDFADTALNGYVVAARWADDRNWPAVARAYFEHAPWLVQKLVVPRVRARVIGALVARDVWRAGADACWARYLRTLDQLEARAPRAGVWVDERLSVADLAIFAQLHSMRTSLTAWQAHALAGHEALSAWLDRVDAATRQAPASGQRLGGSLAAAA
jgi:glutathione S-transferase